MMPFSKRSEVDIHDVDINGIARASSVMKYMQSAAEAQLAENGMSYEEMRSGKRALILSKITVELTGALRTYEPITTVTFPCESRGYTLLRCYSIQKDGVTAVRAISAWALVDTEKLSLVRVNDFDLGLDTYTPLDLPLSRILIPDGIKEVGTYRVNYDDLDQNRHMNNTRYPDIYSNFLPLDGKRITSMTVGYTSEAKAGELLTVLSAYENGAYYFRTLHEDGRENSVAEIRISDI